MAQTSQKQAESQESKTKSINLKELPVGEIFTYLGDRYEVKTKPQHKVDENGNYVPKIKMGMHGQYTDGIEMDEPKYELYKVSEKVMDPERTVKEFGRPLTKKLQYKGPLSPAEIFYVNGTIRFENKDFDYQYQVKDGELIQEPIGNE